MRCLEDARSAYGQRDWSRARAAFATARDAGELLSADDLYAWSDAAWWVGADAETIELCEAAYHRYLDEDQPRQASTAARDIAMVLFLRGEEALGSGWIRRAQRLLEPQPDVPERAYLTYLLEVEGPLGGVAPTAAETASVRDAARHVEEAGRRHGDRTLIALGMLGIGRASVRLGDVAEGLALLDEVMLAVLPDELNPVWAGNISCQLMAAAHELGDVGRAREWTAVSSRWLDALTDAVVYRGICSVHRSQIDTLTGAWNRAEQRARRVCEQLAERDRRSTAEAYYQIGEIRRLRGDLTGAAGAYDHSHRFGRDPQPGAALLSLLDGRCEAASASIHAALVSESAPLARAPLLAAAVEIAIAVGDLPSAIEASQELQSIATTFPSSGLQITALQAHGAVLLATGHPGDALPVLRDACRRWIDVGAPYACARVRMLLAQAYRVLGDDASTERELQAATAVFHQLGAIDVVPCAGLGRSNVSPGGLSRRETEVLALVAAGMSNREVAAALVISDRTVGRHLSNIFTKIGVSSRTAAAAFAFRHGLADPQARRSTSG